MSSEVLKKSEIGALVWRSKCNLAWLFEIERRRGESFLCLPSPTLLPFPSPSRPMFWFWPRSSRTVSLSLRLPLRRPTRFSVGSRLCLSTGHSWFPFTQAQSTLYLLRETQRRSGEQSYVTLERKKDVALLLLSFSFHNSPAAIVKIKTDGDLCALGDRPQWVDV